MKLCPQCGSEYELDVKFCPKDGSTLRVPAGGSLEGSIIADRYLVLRKLGEGGMGQVYLAEHVKMGRKSAIKVMNPSMSQDPDAIGRFNREAANASRITHNNVAAIYDFGETPDGLIYLAMEYVEGEPLTKLLERSGALPAERAADIAQQVGAGLDAAHEMGIVHRDLKPDNIMVAKARDGSDVVKVVDFGIAKAGAGEGQKVTKTGLIVGTPEYMSPEQLSGDQLDGRSDTYTLALVTFNMLTGTLPFPSTTIQESMIMRLTDRPRTLSEMRPDATWPAPLQAVLDRALQRKAEDRYQKSSDFADELVRAVHGMPSGERAAPVAAAGATGATVPSTAVRNAAGTGTSRPLAPTAPSAVPPAVAAAAAGTAQAPAPRRSRAPLVFAALGVAAVAIGVEAWLHYGPRHAGAAQSPVVAMHDSAPPTSPRAESTAAKTDSTASHDTTVLASAAQPDGAGNKAAVQPYEKPSTPAPTVTEPPRRGRRDAHSSTAHAPPASSTSAPAQQPPTPASSTPPAPGPAATPSEPAATADSEFEGPLTGERARLAVNRAADMIKNHEPARALRVLGRALKALPTGNDSVTALYHVSEALLEQSEATNNPAPKQRACTVLGSLRNARGSTYYQSINYLFGTYCQ